MANQISKKLRAFALARHKAYVINDRLNQPRAKAIAKILRVCDHFQNAMQDGWISQIKNDLLAILPSEEGKFRNQRADILNILNTHT